VISYFALAAGFLTGKYRSAEDAIKSLRGANTVKKYLNERGLKILAALDEATRRIGAPPACVAIAWLISQPGLTAPIASASTTAQLEELVQGCMLTLDDETRALLDQASA
jgi:aryl-alcohol dehydrogenase-like predicted oxidoreductase